MTWSRMNKQFVYCQFDSEGIVVVIVW